MRFPKLLFIPFLVSLVTAQMLSSIDSTGSFNCASDSSSVIVVKNFRFSFDRLTSSVYYSATGTAKETVNATAKISLYIYGNKVATREVKFCEYGVLELCPINKDQDVTITGNHSVPSQYVSSILDLAFTIPDLEGNIYIELYDVSDTSGSKQLGCFRSDITNGNTAEVSQAKWGTAVAAIVALVVAMASSAALQAPAPGPSGAEGNAAAGHAAGGQAAGAGNGAAGATAASGPGTNTAAGGFHAPGLCVLLNWLQTMSINGVYSVDYPKVYRSFTRNFSWTCGILEFKGLEPAIDRMRNHTGGNLTMSSFETLEQTTLYEDALPESSRNALNLLLNNSTESAKSSLAKRSLFIDKLLETVSHYTHESGTFSVYKRSMADGTNGANGTLTTYSKYVNGLEAYLEKNHIPFTNGFCTLLVWWCIILLVIIGIILLFKVALELYYNDRRMKKLEEKWAQYQQERSDSSLSPRSSASSIKRINRGSRVLTMLLRRSVTQSNSAPKPPPKPKFQDFRKNYRNFLRITLIRVIVILYGAWVLLLLYQFRVGDSWALILLAALTFSGFTLVLIAYAIRIWYLAYVASKKRAAAVSDAASVAKSISSGAESLFTHEPWIKRYGVFYDEFKVKFWWFFIPSFAAVFGRNAFIALGVGHPLIQIFGQLAIDVVLCAFFCVYTPFNTKMGNGLNILIQVVRIISLFLTFLFTDVVSLSRIRQTAVGFVLIALQASLTVLLVLLIIANAFKGILNGLYEGHKQKRKAKKMEKETMESNRDSIQLIDLDSPRGSMESFQVRRPNQGSIFVEDFGNDGIFSDTHAVQSQKLRISNPFDSKNAVSSDSLLEEKPRHQGDDEFNFIELDEDEDLNRIVSESFKLKKNEDDDEDINDDLRLFRKV